MIRKLAFIPILLMLAGCTTGPPQTPAMKATLGLAGFCSAIGRVYEDLDLMRDEGVLGSGDISLIKRAVAVTDPFCLPGAVIFNLKTAMDAVDRELTRMIIIRLKKDK